MSKKGSVNNVYVAGLSVRMCEDVAGVTALGEMGGGWDRV